MSQNHQQLCYQCVIKENLTAEHERMGPKVLQKVEQQEIQAGIQSLESFDDAPEGDMTVFV